MKKREQLVSVLKVTHHSMLTTLKCSRIRGVLLKELCNNSIGQLLMIINLVAKSATKVVVITIRNLLSVLIHQQQLKDYRNRNISLLLLVVLIS